MTRRRPPAEPGALGSCGRLRMGVLGGSALAHLPLALAIAALGQNLLGACPVPADREASMVVATTDASRSATARG